MSDEMHSYRDQLLLQLKDPSVSLERATDLLTLFKTSFREDTTAPSFCGGANDLFDMNEGTQFNDPTIKQILMATRNEIAASAMVLDPQMAKERLKTKVGFIDWNDGQHDDLGNWIGGLPPMGGTSNWDGRPKFAR